MVFCVFMELRMGINGEPVEQAETAGKIEGNRPDLNPDRGNSMLPGRL